MPSSLPILMTSTSYPRSATDWRGVFIRDMVNALAADPFLQVSLWAPPGVLPPLVRDACLPEEARWLTQLLEQGGIAQVLRKGKGLARITSPVGLLWLLRNVYRRSPDVALFHVNWLQNALPLLCTKTKQPALITVLGSDLGLLRLPGMSWLLRKTFQQRRCMLAPNAEWMTMILKEHFGEVAEIAPISFGIDEKWYAVQRQWSSERPSRWLVVSRITAPKIGPLFAWGESLFSSGVQELHLFGPRQDSLPIPAWVHYHGATHPQALQEQWFPQATGLITLSQHNEGRPQVVLEAMAAGVPVLASPLPAHTDVIAHRKTGWLAPSADFFHEGIRWLSERQANEDIARQARAFVKEQMGTWEDCAGRYRSAYQKLV